MMLRPEIEALVQGALDGSLSSEDRQTLDQLMASDPSVRARAGELEQLLALLQSVRQVDAPPTFAADVLARIHATSESPERVVEFSRRSKPGKSPAVRGGVSVNKNIILGSRRGCRAGPCRGGLHGESAGESGNRGHHWHRAATELRRSRRRDVAVGDTRRSR